MLEQCFREGLDPARRSVEIPRRAVHGLRKLSIAHIEQHVDTFWRPTQRLERNSARRQRRPIGRIDVAVPEELPQLHPAGEIDDSSI
jgi:hypothetical protein